MKQQTQTQQRNTKMNKERMRLELALTVAQYQMNGGTVTVLKPQKNKVNRSVRGKEKLVFGTTEPKNRPATMFDAILSV